MSRVILFDIDNTLLNSGGAGSHAMNIAFQELFGVPDGFARVEFSGRTDRYILQGGLAAHAIEGGCDQHLLPFTSRYYGILPRTLKEREGHLMPGFPELLEELEAREVRLGLATGNFAEAARIKLEFYGIAQYFHGGGFGEESVDRSDVVKAAIASVANGAHPRDILVVGDTPHDVQSALENGVVAVGVATGTFSVEDLRAAGAQMAFTDFSDWQRAAAKLLGNP
jgi:phosphoglycolate phosphatase